MEVRGTAHWLTPRDGPGPALAGDAGRAGTAATGSRQGRTGSLGHRRRGRGRLGSATVPARVTVCAPPRRLGAGAIGRVAGLAAAPDGTAVAVAALDGRVLVVDVASGEVTGRLARSEHGEMSGLAWSGTRPGWPGPSPGAENAAQIRTAGSPTARGAPVATPARFVDTDPVFTPMAVSGVPVHPQLDPVYDATSSTCPFSAAPGRTCSRSRDDAVPVPPRVGGRPTGDDGRAAARQVTAGAPRQPRRC